MRASKEENGESVHISGAEKILTEKELGENAAALIGRALHHAKGEADFINLKIEAAPKTDIRYIDALPVSTLEVATPEEGQAAIIAALAELGIENGAAIMAQFRHTYAMRGAMLLDADTLERLEPDRARHPRHLYGRGAWGGARRQRRKEPFPRGHRLGQQSGERPHILAEICMSDDPDYVAGYVAALSIGYRRITKLKAPGSPDGGRIFLYRGPKAEVAETIRYLENRRSW
ncbi:MAG: 6-carboxyhexanoate--CoA ligase [Schwartzia sp. (in: firmicutes)]